jgi:hypothetical protein
VEIAGINPLIPTSSLRWPIQKDCCTARDRKSDVAQDTVPFRTAGAIYILSQESVLSYKQFFENKAAFRQSYFRRNGVLRYKKTPDEAGVY